MTTIIQTTGDQGPAGPGMPLGGTAGQVLTKNSNTDNDTSWQNQTGGGMTLPQQLRIIGLRA